MFTPIGFFAPAGPSLPVPTDSLIFYADAKDAPSGTGAAWPDLSGNGYDGTVSVNGGGGSSMTYTSGDDGYFEYTDNDYHDFGTNVYSDNSWSEFSAVIVARPDGSTTSDNKKMLGWGNNYILNLQPNRTSSGGGRVELSLSGGSAQVAVSSGVFTANTWGMWGVTYDGSTVTFYKGGTSLGTTSQTGTVNTPNTVGPTPGFVINNRPWSGRIAAVVWYNRGLTGTEMTDMDTYFSGRYGY